MRLSHVLTIGCAGALALGACGGSDPTGPTVLYTLSVRAGDGQSGPAGSLLDEPFQVTVSDPSNAPVKGVRVRFRLTGRATAARLTDTIAVTGTDGVARTHLRLGAEGDSAIVLAAVPGQEDRGVTFRALATAGALLASIAPARFAPGDTVTVRGARFNVSAAGNAVFFGPSRGRVIVASGDSLLRVVVPPCLATGTVQVLVQIGSAQTNPVAATVAGVGAPLRLPAFEAVTVSGTEGGNCLVLAPGARYLLIPQFASVGDSAPESRLYALGIDSVLPEPVPPGDADAVRGERVARPRTVRGELERFLRAEERRLVRDGIAAHARAGRPAVAADPAQVAAPEPPPLGSVRSFRVLSNLDGTAFATVSARLRFAGENILVYEDQASPEPLTDALLGRLGEQFDRTLYPLDVVTFGAESDIDGNGRVIVLLSPVVNALTPAARCSASGFTPGFFYGIDLETRDRNSNRAEIFYAFVPDPRGTRSCPHTVDEVMRLLPPTFLHEFQHMISFNQHVLVRGGSEEDVWLNEGLSHIAEELGARHYAERFPPPAGRSLASQLLPDSALAFIRPNLDNAALYLGAPFLSSVTTFADFGTLEERGAAWLFLRWLASQKGDGIYSRLVQTSRTSRSNVEEVAGETFASLFADFGVALYADSVPGIPRSRIPSRYRFAGTSLRELFANIADRSRYPLTLRPAPPVGGMATAAMVQGTFDYYDVQVTRPSGVAVRFALPGGGSFPANLEAQIGVLRLTP